MRKKNILAIGAMAAVFSISCQFIQPAQCGNDNFFNVKTAEAFDLGSIGKELGKQALGKALNVDLNDMQDKKQSMIQNLSLASRCYMQATVDVYDALGYQPENYAQLTATLNNLNNDKTDLGSMKNVGTVTKVDKKEIEARAKDLMDNGTQEQIEAANTLIKKAKSERQAANMYKGLAMRDAGLIIKSSIVALKDGGLSDKVKTISDLSSVAKAAQGVGKDISANSKDLKAALKAYEKKNNIAEVSDKDAEKQMKDFGLE